MKSKRTTKLFAAGVASLAAMAMAVPAAQATTPAPGYEQFAGCPSKEELAGVKTCTITYISGGHFQMGSKDVPISNPMTLSGGVTSTGTVVANAKGGLTPVKQPVPGGIIGLTGLDWLVNFLNIEQLKLYAVTELAGPPVLATGLTLPLKIHLINPVLGNSCYVGSDSSPVTLNMTTGTTSPPPPNEPITGVVPTGSLDLATGILHQDNGTFVDNSFAAPGASGCVLTLLGFLPINLNPLVNSQSGLPSPAGTNETTQDFDLETVAAKKVYP
jgi:hypothetical protein